MDELQRNDINGEISYDVLSSNGKRSYTVPMLGRVALPCDCDYSVKGHKKCKHMRAAEDAEVALQGMVEQPSERATAGTLNNSNKGFGMMR